MSAFSSLFDLIKLIMTQYVYPIYRLIYVVIPKIKTELAHQPIVPNRVYKSVPYNIYNHVTIGDYIYEIKNPSDDITSKWKLYVRSTEQTEQIDFSNDSDGNKTTEIFHLIGNTTSNFTYYILTDDKNLYSWEKSKTNSEEIYPLDFQIINLINLIYLQMDNIIYIQK